MLRYPCLALDHDDTVVRSGPTVNLPPMQEALRRLRPGVTLTDEQFSRYSFSPGFQTLLNDIWRFTPAEKADFYRTWLDYVMTHVPPAWEGFGAFFRRYRAEGGKISVISHSSRENIERDYARLFGFQPDLIFGWDQPEERRKPSPWPVLETARRFRLRPDEILVVDDLKPGCDMARAAGAAFGAAGWAHRIPEIERWMRAHADCYFRSVSELSDYLFSGFSQ